MKYRPEIDGLRAIAVLSVLIYHAKFVFASGVLVSGGFLGVDVFFVISGFLITKIIVQDIQKGRFNYLDFYDRRARRILPALFAVMLASIPFAWLTMLPDSLLEYSQSVLGAIFFSSNFVFLSQDSYTAEPSALKPFLHTWSLGIEEQFYILLPVLLLVIVRRTTDRQTVWLIGAMFVASLGFAQSISTRFPDANFFLLSSRAWELLAGSLVALLQLKDNENWGQHRWASAISGVALLIIIMSLLTFDESTSHPSLLTAIPVLACAAFIAFANDAHITPRLLAHPILVRVGLISYSLYLWHFPLFAFFRLHIGEPSTGVKLGLCLLSLLLAEMSYRVIEKPFRNRQYLTGKRVALLLFGSFLVITAFQISVLLNNGYSQRLGRVETFINQAQAVRLPNGATPDTPLNPLVALGDSHAGILSHTLQQIAEQQNRPFVQIVQDGCPLVAGMRLYTSGKRVPRCEEIFQPRMDAIRHFSQGVFFYSARFALYQDGSRFAEESGYPVLLTDAEDGEPNPQALIKATQNTLQDLLNDGIKLVLVYPIPEMGFDVPKKFQNTFSHVDALSLKRTLSTQPLSVAKEDYLARAGRIIEAFDAIPDHKNLVRLKPADLLCDAARCFAHNDTILYYYDDNHLSPKATSMMVESILPELKRRGWVR